MGFDHSEILEVFFVTEVNGHTFPWLMAAISRDDAWHTIGNVPVTAVQWIVAASVCIGAAMGKDKVVVDWIHVIWMNASTVKTKPDMTPMIRLPFLAFIAISFHQMVIASCDFFKMQCPEKAHDQSWFFNTHYGVPPLSFF